MSSRLDKLTGKIEALVAKKQKLEARQREKLADLFLEITSKGVDLNTLAGLMLNAPQLITPETEGAWQEAGRKFLSCSPRRKTVPSSSTTHSHGKPETTSSKKEKAQHGL